MKCLITGGAGFIGSHVTDQLLDEGHEVVVIDDLSGGFKRNVNPRCHWVRQEIGDVSLKLYGRLDVVYHLAAFAAKGLSVFAPTYDARKNYLAFTHLLTECIQNDVPTVVFCSSGAVYGQNAKCPIDESLRPDPTEPYAIGKYACEKLLSFYAQHFGFNHVILRPYNVYGIRQNLADPYRNVIGIFMRALLNRQPVHVFGTGLQSRAFTHVTDIVPCIVQAGRCSPAFGKKINLGSATPRRLIDVIAAIEAVADCGLIETVNVPPRLDDTMDHFYNNSLAIDLLHFHERAIFEDELQNMFEWAKTLNLSSSRLQKVRCEIDKQFPDVWR